MTRRTPLVAVGASAGGPAALAEILAGLPRDFGAAVVIVQHIDATFAPGLASWLGHHTALAVRLATDGERPRAGEVLVARGPRHLVLERGGRLGHRVEPKQSPYQPSIDVLFQSVAQHAPRGLAIGVLLTGMGRDGAIGLQALRHAGALTLVQDQATSAIYGMPKAAVALEPSHTVLPLREIGPSLVRALTSAENLIGSHCHE